MTHTNPVTCAEVGHCLNPDGDDTCMRCGVDAPQTYPALGLEPLNIEPSYEEKLRDELAKELFLTLVKSVGYSPLLHGVCFDYATTFMTERSKRVKGGE